MEGALECIHAGNIREPQATATSPSGGAVRTWIGEDLRPCCSIRKQRRLLIFVASVTRYVKSCSPRRRRSAVNRGSTSGSQTLIPWS